jgi:hypothetical protein
MYPVEQAESSAPPSGSAHSVVQTGGFGEGFPASPKHVNPALHPALAPVPLQKPCATLHVQLAPSVPEDAPASDAPVVPFVLDEDEHAANETNSNEARTLMTSSVRGQASR